MWPFSNRLSDIVRPTTTVVAGGVKFKIRRLTVTDHLAGLRCLVETYATYDRKRELEKLSYPDVEKLKESIKPIYKEVFLAAVIYPKLTDKENSDGQFVDDLFDDWNICHELYTKILNFSIKKKNPKSYVVRSKILEIDAIAKRYSKLPSEFLDLSIDEYQFNLMVCSYALQNEAKLAEKQNKKSQLRRVR